MTYKPSRILSWLALNGLFATLGYLGLIQSIDGARNAFIFMAWLCSICAILCLEPKTHEKLYRMGPSIPAFIGAVFDIAITLALVWFGYYFTGTFYIIGVLAQHHIFTNKPAEV